MSAALTKLAGVIPPIDIIDSMIVSAGAAEPSTGEIVWDKTTTYAANDTRIVGAISHTVTVTSASPAVVSWTAHGLPNGTAIDFTNVGGALPAGLTSGRRYYTAAATTDAFQIAETVGGPSIATTSTGTGTHTCRASFHRTYLSLVGTNLNAFPPATPASWADIGPTNQWAMHDLLTTIGTSGPSPLTRVINPGQRITSIALDGLVAESVTVTVKVAGVVQYTTTVSLSTRHVSTWYEHLTTPFTYRNKFYRLDLPPYVGAAITVTATRAAGPVTIGHLILGRSVDLGTTVVEPEDDLLNFSTFDRQFDGQATLVPRRSVPKISLVSIMDKARVLISRKARSDLNAKPAFYYGVIDDTDDYADALSALAIYRGWRHTLDQPATDYATLNLDLEGA